MDRVIDYGALPGVLKDEIEACLLLYGGDLRFDGVDADGCFTFTLWPLGFAGSSSGSGGDFVPHCAISIGNLYPAVGPIICMRRIDGCIMVEHEIECSGSLSVALEEADRQLRDIVTLRSSVSVMPVVTVAVHGSSAVTVSRGAGAAGRATLETNRVPLEWEVVVGTLEHIHDLKRYTRALKDIVRTSGVSKLVVVLPSGRGRPRVLFAAVGTSKRVRELLSLWKTTAVDVDTRGRPCKERLLHILYNRVLSHIGSVPSCCAGDEAEFVTGERGTAEETLRERLHPLLSEWKGS